MPKPASFAARDKPAGYLLLVIKRARCILGACPVRMRAIVRPLPAYFSA